jgi:hypothetical protein
MSGPRAAAGPDGGAAFTLPLGLPDAGDRERRHRQGRMRPALARDEWIARRDPRVQANPAAYALVMLSRVIEELGPLRGEDLTPERLAELPSADLEHLRAVFRSVNDIPADPPPSTCPRCGAPI